MPSAFYDRFTVATVRFLRAVVSDLCADFQNADAHLGGVLAGFRDVVVADATLIKLYRMPSDRPSVTSTSYAHRKSNLQVAGAADTGSAERQLG